MYFAYKYNNNSRAIRKCGELEEIIDQFQFAGREMLDKYGPNMSFSLPEIKLRFRAAHDIMEKLLDGNKIVSPHELLPGHYDHEVYPYEVGDFVIVRVQTYRHMHLEILSEIANITSANDFTYVEEDSIEEDELVYMLTCKIDIDYYRREFEELKKRLNEEKEENARLRRELKEKGAEFGELITSLKNSEKEQVYESIKRLLGDK